MKRVFFVLVLCMLGALIGAGCGGGSDSSSNGPVTSTPTTFNSLVFTVSTPHSRYAKGAPIPVTFTVTNTAAQEATMQIGGCFDYTVQFSRGGSVVWVGPNLGCGIDLTTLSIAAGATKTYTISWSTTDPLNDPDAFNGIMPTPGAYTILAKLAPNTLNGAILTDAQRATLVSNPISITVTP